MAIPGLPKVELCCGLFGRKASLVLIMVYTYLKMYLLNLSLNYPLCKDIHGPHAFGTLLFGIKFFECVFGVLLCMINSVMFIMLFMKVPVIKEFYCLGAAILAGFTATYWILHFGYTVARPGGCVLCIRFYELEDEIERRLNATVWEAFNKSITEYEEEKEFFRTSITPYPLYYWYYNSRRWTTPSRLPITKFTYPPLSRQFKRVKNYTEANGYNNECRQWVQFPKAFNVRWMTCCCPLWGLLEALIQVYLGLVVNSYQLVRM